MEMRKKGIITLLMLMVLWIETTVQDAVVIFQVLVKSATATSM
jgi:hypothetical protein